VVTAFHILKVETRSERFTQHPPQREGGQTLRAFVSTTDIAVVAWEPMLLEGLLIPCLFEDDLSQAAAHRLVQGGVLKGVAAQRPYEQGRTAAVVALLALTGNPVPPWIALPGIAVTADNVAEAYEHVGGAPASPALMVEKSSD